MKARLLILALLGGCATGPVDYSATRDSWQGATYETAVAQWGQPTHISALPDGRNAYTWFSQSNGGGGSWYPSVGVFGGSRGVGTGVGAGFVLGGGGPGGEGGRCERTLIFKDGRVAEQTWQGQPGFCSYFRRN